MKIHFFLYLMVLMIFSSCDEPEYIHLSDKIVNAYIKDVKYRYGFHLDGSGGSMMNDITVIRLMFSSINTVKLDQARIIFVDSVENLLNRVNSDEKIRPYLHNFPFTIDNIQLDIGFLKPGGKFVDGEFIATISLIKGKIFYGHYNMSKDRLENLYSEPYEEAIKIVREQNDQKEQ
jgi:hypothetical protein